MIYLHSKPSQHLQWIMVNHFKYHFDAFHIMTNFGISQKANPYYVKTVWREQ